MERLQQLINQLQEQSEMKADPSQMLQTVRLLEAELSLMSAQAAVNKGTAKVAVMMPSSMKIYSGQAAMREVGASSANVVVAADVAPPVNVAPPQTNPPAPPEVRLAPEPQYGGRQERDGRPERDEERYGRQEREEERYGRQERDEERYGRPREVVKDGATRREEDGGTEKGPWPYDPLAEIPTLAQQQKPRELNDVIGRGGASLNDKLRTDRLDLKSALNDTPVRDLKKAIGVNDRFVFISQLFRGDEVMYERSLKTINGFRILPEAEYWMERELKVKLGWDESREATKHFYHLVRRRFA